MTAQDLKPILRKTKRLVLEGQRGQTLADSLGVCKKTANNYINQLVYMGELIEVKGPKNSTPKIYEDGKARVFYNSKFTPSEEQTQTGGKSTENGVFSERVVPSTPNLPSEGIPSKCVRFHCTGCYDVPVISLGDHAGRIIDSRGLSLGQWSELKNSNGSRRQYGTVRLYPNEDLKFTLFYLKNPEQYDNQKDITEKITITPNPRDVYYKTAKKEGPVLLQEQVNRLLDVLTYNHHWVFGQPVFKGTYHFALDTPELAPLLQFHNKEFDHENARVHVDTSEGSPEIEFYADPNGDMDRAQEDAINFLELPQLLDGLKQSVGQIYGTLRIVASSVGELTKITAELVKVQAQTVETTVKAQIKEFDGAGYQ